MISFIEVNVTVLANLSVLTESTDAVKPLKFWLLTHRTEHYVSVVIKTRAQPLPRRDCFYLKREICLSWKEK